MTADEIFEEEWALKRNGSFSKELDNTMALEIFLDEIEKVRSDFQKERAVDRGSVIPDDPHETALGLFLLAKFSLDV